MTKKTAAKKVAKKTTRKKAVGFTPPAPRKPPPPADGQLPAVNWSHQSTAEKDEALGAWMHAVNSAERKLVVRADEAPNTYFLRRPMGVIDLDIDLGGGFPAGGCCMVSGPDNAGKTWLVLKTMAMQQRLYGEACRLGYAVTEGSFPFDQAVNAGLKVKVPDEMISQWQQWRMLRGIPVWTDEQVIQLFKQEIGKIWVIRGYTGEELLQVMIEGIRTNGLSLMACDSIAGLLPNVDASKTMDKRDQMSAQASMMTKFFRKYAPTTTGLMGPNLTTLLFTQQVRANMSRADAPPNMQKYIKLWSVAGAYAAKHFKLIDLVVWSGKTLRQGKEGKGPVLGKMLKWQIEKGKAGTHDNLGGEAAFYYALGGTDDIGELFASGVRRGVIHTAGKGVVVVRPDTGQVLNEFRAPTQKAFRKMLQVDPEFEFALRREILTAAGKQCLYQ